MQGENEKSQSLSGNNLASAVKTRRKHFYKYITNNRRTEENLAPLLYTVGNIVVKG